jgi:hypothetical protein
LVEFGGASWRVVVLFCAVEKIVGGICDADFLAGVGGVATGGWGFAAFGVEALDVIGAIEDAFAIVGDYVDQEPGDGVRIGRWDVRGGFAYYFAAIAGFPGRAGVVLAEEGAVFEELGVGGFEGPSGRSGVGFADVDLIAFALQL